MKLYHGTNYSSAVSICSNGIDLRQSKPYLDFGPGFYATPSYHHAALTAIRTTDKINQWNRRKQKDYKFEEPYIVQFKYKPLSDLELKQISFPRHGAEWGAFVLNNRLTSEILSQYGIENHNQDCRYDICIGEIADGTIVNIAYQVNSGILLPKDVNYEKFLKKNNESYGQQYSFHSEKSISCIIGLSCDIIKNKERYIK